MVYARVTGEHTWSALFEYTLTSVNIAVPPSWMRSPPPSLFCDAKTMSTRTATSQFNGAMEDMSGKVENASTHFLRCQSSEHAHTAVGQFKGQFSGAMEERSGQCRRLEKANTQIPLPRSRTR